MNGERVSLFDQIGRNRRNSIILTFLVFAVAIGLVYTIAQVFDPASASFFLLVAVLIMAIDIYASYNYGDRIVLSATNARPANPRVVAEKHLIDVVEGLAIAAGIPAPKAYIMDSTEMNAFATGKDPTHASVAVTSALLKNMNREELEGVLGHELSHVRNYDIRFAMLVAVLVGLVAILSNLLIRSYWWGGPRYGNRDREGRGGGGGAQIFILVGFLLAILSPIFVRFVQAAISRKREYLADASGAQLTRYPRGLASALEKIKKANQGKTEVSEALSHLFFVDPTRSPLDSLYATHPPIEERIKILRAM